MDTSQSGHSKQEDTRGEDSAIMLFGKQIKNLSNAEKIKEELSPRGVDEKGLSFATSSDDDEDLCPASENSMHVTPMGSVLASETSREHAKKRKAIESGCVGGDNDAKKPKSIATESSATVRMGGDDHAEQLKSSLWSRCPRCNSADTKFCYFNNYNVNQPRHFCKHCQRYWTAGGTLRNVPIGAGKRKNKHTLHKNGFVTNSSSAFTIPTPSLPLGVADTAPLPMVKSEPLPTPESGALSIVKTDLVNTNLELSAHNPFTDSVTSSLPPCNIIHPHSAHKLITLHQRQENPQSGLSQLNHYPHECSTNFGQIYPNLACGQSSLSPIYPQLASNLASGQSSLSPIYPQLASNLACGQSSISQGHPNSEDLRQINPFLHNGLYGSSQIYPHLRGGFPGLAQICPDLQSGSSEFARSGPHLQSGLCNLCHTFPHVLSGSCSTSQECLNCKRKELSGLAKSERGFSEVDVESELPMPDQKSANLERGLPDTVTIASEKQNKASSLQIGHPEMGPNEVDKCMQRLNEVKAIGCCASNESKADMRGSCHATIDRKAAPMCLQSNNAQTSSTSALVIKSEEASNIENLMTRGAGEGQNSLLNIWGSLWPCFYNMFWLDPLAFSHVKPILTPQGWALPFIPPSVPKVEPTSYSPHSITSPTTNMSQKFDSSSTLTASSTPTTLLAPFEDICNSAHNIGTTLPGKHLVQPPTTSSWQCR